MTPQEFIQKWRNITLTERSAAQQHFLDLCALVDHPTPATLDKTGETFTFERGVAKGGTGLGADGNGWADVWKKGHFAWEYKGPHKDLGKAYAQLQQYREDLENPPLLVVSDMDRIIIHTNFTATPVEVHEIPLAELGSPENLEKLRALFHAPEKLRPGLTSERITAKAAGRLAELAQSLRDRDYEAHTVARFLDRVVFCLFAEDIALLPEKLFTRLLEKTHDAPERFAKHAKDLFEAMATGGDFHFEDIRHFNGNLFTDCTVLELTPDELKMLYDAARLDWSAIDPSIFGTLFERGMDPTKRSQLGAHYTSREDIETLIEPVVMLPLRRDWCEVRTTVESLLATGRKPVNKLRQQARDELRVIVPEKTRDKPTKKARNEAFHILARFQSELAHVKVLDPACGSGNFLYVTLQKLKDLEKEVILYAQDTVNESLLPLVGPWQLYGIELNPYAFDLAQMTVWIGYLQWTRANGFGITQDPILRTMDKNFQCTDAILQWEGGGAAPTPPLEEQCPSRPPNASDPAESQAIPAEPDWPRVDFIVGNPPFLGGNKIRQELGDETVEALFSLYEGRVPAFADLCCYWFEKARAHIEAGKVKRAGLLATQGIRGGANRKVLERIKETGDIFFAESDRPWVLDGANVHVSMVGFDSGNETTRQLDQANVDCINSNLTATADITEATVLQENTGYCFMGPSPKAPFDIDDSLALSMLVDVPQNVHLRPNSDVIRRVASAVDLTKSDRQKWTIDFGLMEFEQAVGYEIPFEYVRETVLPVREARKSQTNKQWWQYERPRHEMREKIVGLHRVPVTPAVAKHRLFVWTGQHNLCNQGTLVFARSDDYFFGVLHSRLHEVWALKLGTRLETRPRYTPTTCFETFPFPWAPGEEPVDDPLVRKIAESAKTLCELRDNWLNPPEWTTTEVLEFPGTVGGPWDRYIERDEGGKVKAEEVKVPGGETIRVGTVKYPRTVPKDDDCAKKLKKRTLTNLYNERPAWLAHAHQTLDTAVAQAYAQTTHDPAWTPDMTDEEILEKLLALNLARAD